MLIHRYQKNPILTKDDVPYPVATVHNAAVVKYQGKYIMIFRSHKLNGRSILGMAQSDDGYNFKVNDKPFMIPSTEGIFKEYEAYGVEDPRIIFMDGEYLITYSAYSKHGVRIGLAKTKDFTPARRAAQQGNRKRAFIRGLCFRITGLLLAPSCQKCLWTFLGGGPHARYFV